MKTYQKFLTLCVGILTITFSILFTGCCGEYKTDNMQASINAAEPLARSEEYDTNAESYQSLSENDFLRVQIEPVSTFSIDVDAAGYSNSRRYIEQGQLPPKEAVRVEEFVNYFNYHYKQPLDDLPLSVYSEVSQCPWNPSHHLVHIGLQGKEIATEKLPPSNLTFLIDVSGSMSDPNKLPLLKPTVRTGYNLIRRPF